MDGWLLCCTFSFGTLGLVEWLVGMLIGWMNRSTNGWMVIWKDGWLDSPHTDTFTIKHFTHLDITSFATILTKRAKIVCFTALF